MPRLFGSGTKIAPGGGPEALKFYVFKGWNGANAGAAAGPAIVEVFGDFATFSTYFGGGMHFGRLFHSDEFLGVWGTRNVSRLRRILREHHGELEIIHSPPPVRHSGSSMIGLRLTRLERETIERRILTRL